MSHAKKHILKVNCSTGEKFMIVTDPNLDIVTLKVVIQTEYLKYSPNPQQRVVISKITDKDDYILHEDLHVTTHVGQVFKNGEIIKITLNHYANDLTNFDPKRVFEFIGNLDDEDIDKKKSALQKRKRNKTPEKEQEEKIEIIEEKEKPGKKTKSLLEDPEIVENEEQPSLQSILEWVKKHFSGKKLTTEERTEFYKLYKNMPQRDQHQVLSYFSELSKKNQSEK